eukprot:m.4219 g.4219  ORF g.4219 m.4219 type:complete len:116 (+) comp10419_c0_seq1:86-433(+)
MLMTESRGNVPFFGRRPDAVSRRKCKGFRIDDILGLTDRAEPQPPPSPPPSSYPYNSPYGLSWTTTAAPSFSFVAPYPKTFTPQGRVDRSRGMRAVTYNAFGRLRLLLAHERCLS